MSTKKTILISTNVSDIKINNKNKTNDHSCNVTYISIYYTKNVYT